MFLRPPRSTRTDTPVLYTTLFRSPSRQLPERRRALRAGDADLHPLRRGGGPGMLRDPCRAQPRAGAGGSARTAGMGVSGGGAVPGLAGARGLHQRAPAAVAHGPHRSLRRQPAGGGDRRLRPPARGAQPHTAGAAAPSRPVRHLSRLWLVGGQGAAGLPYRTEQSRPLRAAPAHRARLKRRMGRMPSVAALRSLFSRSGGIGRAFSNRNFRIWTSGNVFSLISTWIQRVAVGWPTWELTESGAWLGQIGRAHV